MISEIAGAKHYSGLSTDTKPTGGRIGSTFTEEDTGVVFKYGASGWYESGVSIISGDSAGVISVQNPLPTDGDSVYCKDLNISECNIYGFTGGVCDFFNDYTLENVDSSVTNPKKITLVFKRPILTSLFGIGSKTGNFSNVKISFKDFSGTIRETVDFSADGTKHTSIVYPIPPTIFIEVDIEFYTADTVSINGFLIPKNTQGVVRLQALKPDGTVIDLDATTGGNLKISLEEYDGSFDTSPLPVKTFGLISDTELRIPRIDSSTHSIQTIQNEHYEIHDGEHFELCGYIDLGLNESVEIVITTPNTTTWGHFTWVVDVTQTTILDIYEGTTGITGGTTLTPLNNNRNSSNISAMVIVQDPTSITSDGTLLPLSKKIGANKSAGQDARSKEIIAKQNELYLLRATSLVASNTINFCISWYEHANIG